MFVYISFAFYKVSVTESLKPLIESLWLHNTCRPFNFWSLFLFVISDRGPVSFLDYGNLISCNLYWRDYSFSSVTSSCHVNFYLFLFSGSPFLFVRSLLCMWFMPLPWNFDYYCFVMWSKIREYEVFYFLFFLKFALVY